MDALDLIAKIKMDLDEYEKGLDTAKSSASKAGSGISSTFSKVASGVTKAMATATKVTAAAVGAAATAVTALASKAVSLYGEYEQMEGGINKLFGTGNQTIEQYAESVGKTIDEVAEEYGKLESSFNKVMDNASKAWTTAGLSANDYMSTVTSISGALIGALDGDKAAAADYADRAVVQMSDIANTFGYTVDEISEKYKSISRGMYQTLDDLTAGAYAGNKTGYQNLIDDMSKMTDIQEDLNLTVKEGEYDYANFVNAMEVYNTKMGIAGTTAREATETIQGSLNSMKAAWTNLLTGMGDSEADFESLMDNLVTSVVGKTETVVSETGVVTEEHTKGFLDNILPVVEQTLTGMATLIENLVPAALDLIPTLIEEVLPKIATAAENLVSGLTSTLSENMSTISEVLSQLVESIVSLLPDIMTLGGELVSTLASAIFSNMDTILDAAGKILDTLTTGIGNNAEKIASGAMLIISKIVSFFAEHVSETQAASAQLMIGIANGFAENLDILIDSGISWAMAALEGLLSVIPEMIEQAGVIIKKISDALIDHADEIYDAATQMFLMLVDALPDIMIALGNALENIFTAIVNLLTGDGSTEIYESAFMMFLEIAAALPQILTAVLGGIWEILNSLVSALLDGGQDLFVAACEMFGNIGMGLIEKGAEVLTDLKTEVSEWVQAVKDTVKDWYEAGKSLISGIWSGFTSKFSEVYNGIKSKCNSLTSMARSNSVFDINSPSKVWAKIGSGLSEGLEKGWDDDFTSTEKTINKDLTSLTEANSKLSMTTSTTSENGTRGNSDQVQNITLYATTTLDGKKVGESTYNFTVDKMNGQQRALAVAQGGYY